MCSERECIGKEEGFCDYYGYKIPYNLIQIAGHPINKESAKKMFENNNKIVKGINKLNEKVFCKKCYKDYINVSMLNSGRICGNCGTPFE